MHQHHEYTGYEKRVLAAVTQFHKNFNARDFRKNGELVSDKLRVTSNGKEVVGREAFVEQIARFTTPFPDVHIEDLYTVVDGNIASVRFVVTGTHMGDLQTPDGVVHATGRPIKIDGIEYFTFDEDAKLMSLVTVEDLAGLGQQIKGKK